MTVKEIEEPFDERLEFAGVNPGEPMTVKEIEEPGRATAPALSLAPSTLFQNLPLSPLLGAGLI